MVAFLTEPREALRADTREPTECYTLSVTSTTWALGERIARDPIGEWGGFNLYSFLDNMTLNRTDYLGLKTGTCNEASCKSFSVRINNPNVTAYGPTGYILAFSISTDSKGNCPIDSLKHWSCLSGACATDPNNWNSGNIGNYNINTNIISSSLAVIKAKAVYSSCENCNWIEKTADDQMNFDVYGVGNSYPPPGWPNIPLPPPPGKGKGKE